MPRNDQAVRQHIVLTKLGSSRHGLTLEQLAEGLDPSITRHPRTLRRDLDAIESAGWPLLTERIDGRTRWKLLDCVRNAPALRLSPTELMALALSRRLVAPLEGTAVYASLQSALNKASAALPPEGLLMVHQLEETFSVGLGPHKQYKHHREVVERLTQSITEKKRIQMRYDSASRGKVTRREVDPYRLWYAAGGLYLIGYCHLRKEPRMFAVERIKSSHRRSGLIKFHCTSISKRLSRTRSRSCEGRASTSNWNSTSRRQPGPNIVCGIRAKS